jgi:hypothetical protein
MDIMENCKNKKVESLCKKLQKKLSFKNGKDVENLCHLVYWLYILDKKELAKKCIELTHNINFDHNYNVWTFIHSIWGLEIRMLNSEDKKSEANRIIEKMNEHYFTPPKNRTIEWTKDFENRRRERFGIDGEIDITNKVEIERCLKDNNIKLANEYRFTAIIRLIGGAETGFYPNLNKNRETIEEIIKNYIMEIVK